MGRLVKEEVLNRLTCVAVSGIAQLVEHECINWLSCSS